MVRDTIAELVNGIKNASKAGKSTVVVPYSKLVVSVAEVLKTEGYITAIENKGKKIVKFVEVTLNPEMPVTGTQRVSHLSKRVYRGADELRGGSRMNGFFVITTPKGVMTHREAKKQKVGGEVLFKLW
jgi:small subunit ribosomal protein S8